MKKATRSFLTLSVLGAVGAGVALVAWIRAGDPQVDQTTTSPKPVVAMNPDDVTGIVVDNRGKSVSLEKQGDGWRITAPIATLADDRELERFIRQLAGSKSVIRYGEGQHQTIPDDKLTGLHTPRATVTISRGNEKATIELGVSSEFNRDVYARVTGFDAKVDMITVSPSTAGSLMRDFDGFRESRIIGAETDRIQKIEVTPRAGVPGRVTYRIAQGEKDLSVPKYRQEQKYIVEEPDLGPADAMTVQGIMSSLTRAPAVKVKTDDHKGDLAAFGLSDPEVTVKVWLKPRYPTSKDDATLTEREIRISSTDAEGAVNVTHSDHSMVLTANAAVFTELFPTRELLESKRLFSFSRDDVARLEFDLSEKSTMTIERYVPPGGEDPEWRMLAPEPGRAKAHLVSAIVLVFSGLVGDERMAAGADAKSEATRAKYGITPASRRLSFFDKSGNVLGTIIFGRAEKDRAFVTSEEGELIVSIQAKFLDTLPATHTELVDLR